MLLYDTEQQLSCIETFLEYANYFLTLCCHNNHLDMLHELLFRIVPEQLLWQ